MVSVDRTQDDIKQDRPQFRILKQDEDMTDYLPKEWKEQKEIPVYIDGLDLPREDRKRIESQIQQMLKEELAKYEQAQRGARLKSLPDQDETKKIRVTLSGLELLPEEHTKRIESQIQEVLTKELAKNGKTVPGIRHCMGPTNLLDRTRYELDLIGRIKPGEYGTFWGRDNDVLQIFVSPRPTGTWGMHAQIGLSFVPKWSHFSGWAKEIQAWTCEGASATIRHEDPGSGTGYTRWMEISGTDPNAAVYGLVFRKPKQFGIMYNMFFFFSDFWYYFVDKRVEFRWWGDTRP